MSDSNAVYSVDYTPMFRQHELSGADITMLYCKKQSADISGTNNVVLKLDREGNVKEILTDPRMQGTKAVSLRLPLNYMLLHVDADTLHS